jgi:hypothetical protein
VLIGISIPIFYLIKTFKNEFGIKISRKDIESAYISKQQIKNWIETDMKFSNDVLQKGR